MDSTRKRTLLLKLRKRLPIFGVLSAVIFLANIFWGGSFFGVLWLFDGALLALLIGAFAIMAGLTVLKALFLVAAELSLMIFLAQAYCTAPLRNAQSDSALRNLLIISLVYIAFTFLLSLYEAAKGHYALLRKDPSWERTLTIIFYIAFIFIFLWEIFLIMRPIVLGLCVL